MTIILDNYTLPKTGHVELNLSFDIVISAEEAQKKVRWWLRDHNDLDLTDHAARRRALKS
jgi:hypothetical protein